MELLFLMLIFFGLAVAEKFLTVISSNFWWIGPALILLIIISIIRQIKDMAEQYKLFGIDFWDIITLLAKFGAIGYLIYQLVN